MRPPLTSSGRQCCTKGCGNGPVSSTRNQQIGGVTGDAWCACGERGGASCDDFKRETMPYQGWQQACGKRTTGAERGRGGSLLAVPQDNSGVHRERSCGVAATHPEEQRCVLYGSGSQCSTEGRDHGSVVHTGAHSKHQQVLPLSVAAYTRNGSLLKYSISISSIVRQQHLSLFRQGREIVLSVT